MKNPVREFEDAVLASRVAARVKQEPKMEAVPRSEEEEVNKHLVAAQWIVKEWVIRANQAQHRPDEYIPVSPAKLKTITKFRDDLDTLQEQVGAYASSRLTALK
jgi:hypothetical protein